MNVVAIIPARGGSKGLPRKNLRLLAGRPLVAHTIEAGLNAAHVDAVYVSTEDAEIAAVARTHGAAVIDRPRELATDDAQNDSVTAHALAAIAGAGQQPRTVVLLQPSSPLRTGRHIDECLQRLVTTGARAAMSVCAVEHHPGKCVMLDRGLARPFTNETDMEARRQDLPRVYRQNGAIYAVPTADFLATKRFYLRPCAAYVMNREDSVDIDDAVDLELAELLLSRRQRPAQ